MNRSPHTMLCALLVVVAYVLVAARASLPALVPALACGLTIGAMLWTVARPRGQGRR